MMGVNCWVCGKLSWVRKVFTITSWTLACAKCEKKIDKERKEWHS